MTYDELEAAYFLQQQEMIDLKEDFEFAKTEITILEEEIVEIQTVTEAKCATAEASLLDTLNKLSIKEADLSLKEAERYRLSNDNLTFQIQISKLHDIVNELRNRATPNSPYSVHNPGMQAAPYMGADVNKNYSMPLPVSYPVSYSSSSATSSYPGSYSANGAVLTRCTEELMFAESMNPSTYTSDMHVLANCNGTVIRFATSPLDILAAKYPRDVENAVDYMVQALKHNMMQHYMSKAGYGGSSYSNSSW